MSLRRVDTSLAERLLYPVIPVAVTAEHDGVIGGMLAAWWMQASFSPLMIAVAIAPERYTYKLASKAGVYALNLLPYDTVKAALFLGDVSARFMRDKLEKSGLTVRRGEALGAPIIEEAYAALELRLHSILPAGDHDLFLGVVEAAYARHPLEENMWRLDGFKPLMYLGRTRRPGPVRRIYVTPTGWERTELDYAAGMRSLVEARPSKEGEGDSRIHREQGGGRREGKRAARVPGPGARGCRAACRRCHTGPTRNQITRSTPCYTQDLSPPSHNTTILNGPRAHNNPVGWKGG